MVAKMIKQLCYVIRISLTKSLLILGSHVYGHPPGEIRQALKGLCKIRLSRKKREETD